MRLLVSAFAMVALVASPTLLAQAPAPAPPPSDPAQTPATTTPPAGEGAQGTPVAPQVGSFTAKYRIQERFTTKDVKPASGLLGQYQVGFREKISLEDATTKEPKITQVICTERPAAVSPVDDRLVTNLIRHYTSVKITPDPWKDRKDRRPNDDLTISYRREMVDTPPQVLVLTPNRSLREEEYTFAVNYDFVTNFAYLLPERPVRIADTWPVARAGAVALINDEKITNGTLTGKLAEIRPHPTVKGMQMAIINVTGRLVTSDNKVLGDVAVNAQLQFAFTPSGKSPQEIEASGAIEKLSLAQVSSFRAPGLTQTKEYKRELVFERKRSATEATLAIPQTMPLPTPANSWLTYADGGGRFQVRHPQEFQTDFARSTKTTTVLARFHSEIPDDIITFEFLEKPQSRPETMFKQLVEEWRGKGVEVLGGLPEKLSAADWPNMTVHHMEAVLKLPEEGGRPAPRPYFDAYMVHFPRNVAINVTATTFQEDPSAFRKQVLGILKTLTLGDPKPESPSR